MAVRLVVAALCFKGFGMVCPGKVGSDSFQLVIDGKVVGETDGFSEVEVLADVEPSVLRDYPSFSVPLMMNRLYVMRSEGVMQRIMNSRFVLALATLVVLRGGFAVRPLYRHPGRQG